jgi:16S rRNA processing protein RimM
VGAERRGGDGFVPLAVIVGAHGVRGELRAKPYNPSSDLLFDCGRLWLREPGVGEAREVRARATKTHKDLVLLTLDGIEDRNAALSLRGSELLLPRAELPALQEGEHYLVDLVGLDAQLADGSPVGRIENVIAYPSCDALCVQTERGTLEVPMLAPYFVEARPEQGVVVVAELTDLEVVPNARRSARKNIKASSQRPR